MRFRRVLIVVKHTPFEAYAQLKLQGKAPKQLRWERLKDRYESHDLCVQELCSIVRKSLPREDQVRVVSREDLGPQHFENGVDLVIPVGGDGTVLSTSHFVDSVLRRTHTQTSGVPEPKGPVVLGVNSDPTKPHERSLKGSDERRSFGALCYSSAIDMHNVLPKVLAGELDHHIQRRHRLAVTVRGTLSETRLPPALNDVLIAHPSPAAVSRFRLDKKILLRKNNDEGFNDLDDLPPSADTFQFNVWSSGIWVASATGATAAVASAGGITDIPKDSPDFQFLVREHLVGENDDRDYVSHLSKGLVNGHQHFLELRWNSQHGNVFIDGAHNKYDIELGDKVLISSHATPLRIFSH